jgi:hypothetical protein
VARGFESQPDLSHQTSPSPGTSVTAGVLRGATKETLQGTIALEVISVPSACDINKSRLLHYRLRVMWNNEGRSEDNNGSVTDDGRSSLNSNG